jgi:hypothetical protein
MLGSVNTLQMQIMHMVAKPFHLHLQGDSQRGVLNCLLLLLLHTCRVAVLLLAWPWQSRWEVACLPPTSCLGWWCWLPAEQQT